MKIKLRFYSHLIRSGILLSPYHHGFLIHEHSEEDIEKVVRVVQEGLETLGEEFYS